MESRWNPGLRNRVERIMILVPVSRDYVRQLEPERRSVFDYSDDLVPLCSGTWCRGCCPIQDSSGAGQRGSVHVIAHNLCVLVRSIFERPQSKAADPTSMV